MKKERNEESGVKMRTNEERVEGRKRGMKKMRNEEKEGMKKRINEEKK